MAALNFMPIYVIAVMITFSSLMEPCCFFDHKTDLKWLFSLNANSISTMFNVVLFSFFHSEKTRMFKKEKS